MMKRKVLIFFLALIALLLSAALGEESPIVYSIEVNPSHLTEPGPVSVTINLSNSSDADLSDPVELYDPAGKPVADFGTGGKAMLKAGETLTWTGTYNVNQRALNNGSFVYYLKYSLYTDGGEKMPRSMDIRGVVGVTSASAALDVKRTITPSAAREGQEIIVRYDLTNVGTLPLSNVTLQENKDIHSKKEVIKTLLAGQTAEIKLKVTMKKADLTSGATITYEAEGVDKQTYTVVDKTILFGESNLTATLSSSSKGVPVNSKVTLTLKLKNTGTLDYSNIIVTDATLGDVFSNQQLAAGKTLELTKEITLTATTVYQFNITATDTSGVNIDVATDEITVTSVDPEDVLTLALTLTSDSAELYEQPGYVRFSLLIENNSTVEAKNVKISHGDTDIYTYDSIPAGQSRRLTRDTEISMAGKFRFTAAATDALDNQLSFQSNDIQIVFSVPTPAPATPTPPPVPTAEPTFAPVTMPPISDASIGGVPKLIQNILLPILILAGLAFLASGTLLLIAAKRRFDQKRASDAAVDQLERVKRRDYKNPAQPKLDEENAAAEADDGSQDEPEDWNGRRIIHDADDEDFELPHMKYARINEEAHNANADEDSAYLAVERGLFDDETQESFYGEDNADNAAVYDDRAMYAYPDEQNGDGYAEGDGFYQTDEYYTPEGDAYSYDESYQENTGYDGGGDMTDTGAASYDESRTAGEAPYDDSMYQRPENSEQRTGRRSRSRRGGGSQS